MSRLTEVEGRLLDEVSAETLFATTGKLAGWERVSGTEGERAAAAYLRHRLEAAGLRVSEYRPHCLLSWPEHASLSCPDADAEFEVLSHSFSASTPGSGLQADLAWGLPEPGRDAPSAAGRIVVFEGVPRAAAVSAATSAGAAGVVFIQVDDHLHNAHTTPVWGNPTTKTAALLPRLPSVSVRHSDGERLRELARSGRRARLVTRTFRGWREVPVLTADVPGAVDPGHYVLVSGHHDSWHRGAMDNASACATMVELARILERHREHLHRSVRFAFWPGHSQGTYAGSTWYADNFWEDIHDNCVLQVTVDSTGARGATVYRATSMPETDGLAVAAIADAIGATAESRRIARTHGDQSFWGSGVPSVFITLSAVPAELAVNKVKGQPLSGTPWYWHTPEDTIDKLDPEVLRLDARVYLLAALRAAGSPLLPLRFGAPAREIREALERYQAAAGERFELGGVIERARTLEDRLRQLDAALDRLGRGEALAADRALRIGGALQDLERELVVVNFTSEGPFEQDLDVAQPPVPGLARAPELAVLAEDSDEARFLATELVRRRNRVAHHLRRALQASENASVLLESVTGS